MSKTDLVETDTQRDITPVMSIDEVYALLLDEWKGVDKLIETTRDKLRKRRIAIGHLLLQLQHRIDSGEYGEQATFWEWFDEMVPGRSRSDARGLMHTAAQDDPEGTYQHKLEKQKEYNDRYYRKKLGTPETEVNSGDQLQTNLVLDPEAEPEPDLLPPAPRPKPRYPTADTDDSIIKQALALLRHLSPGGWRTFLQKLRQLQNDRKRGRA
jgi:hypothetical protein